MTSVNISNTQTDLHSDKCNQEYENYQNDNQLNYQLLSSVYNNRLSKIKEINTNVRNIGGLSRDYNLNIDNENRNDLVQTENWLFNLHRTLSNCPTLNDPNLGKICKNNNLNSVNLYGESTRLSHPLYNYNGLDLYGYDQNGRNLNRNGNIHTVRPIANAVSIGLDTKSLAKDNYKNTRS